MIHNSIPVAVCAIALIQIVNTEAAAVEQNSAPKTETSATANDKPHDWPSIRGSHFDGISTETGLASEWPANGPPVIWVRELGAGYSSFVARGDRVYTQYQTLRGQFVVCLDAQSGETIWQYRYDWPFEPGGLYPGPLSTPTLAHGNVYFSTPKGAVACLNDEGKLLWRVNLKENFAGRGTGFGYACSPTVSEGKIIMPVGGEGAGMVALDARDGSMVWKSGSAPASYTPALPIVVDGHTQVIGYMQNGLVCFDLATGDELWNLRLSEAYDEHAAWPLYREPFLWFSGPFQVGSQLVRITGGPDADFERVREGPVMSNDVASSVLYQGNIYGFDLRDIQSKAHRPSRGSFRCLDFETGDEHWSNGDPNKRPERQAKPTIGHASVIVADGKLILFNDRGELILARATPDKYNELGRVSVLEGEICWTTPMLHQRRLYLRNHSQAVCLYLGSENISSPAKLSVTDIPQGTTKDLSHILGVEPEYALDPPTWKWLTNWYFVSLAMFVASAVVAMPFMRIPKGEPIAGQRPSQPISTIVFWVVAFCLGALLTRPLSELRGDFVFTWPVSLYVVFHATVYRVRLRKTDPAGQPVHDRIQLFVFALAAGFYYLACRMVSLVTEWVFLCGFPLALVILLGIRFWRGQRWHAKRHPTLTLLYEICFTVFGFTAFFWSTVALLSLKYKILES